MDPYISHHSSTRSPWVGHRDEVGVRTRIRALKARFEHHHWYARSDPSRLRVFKLDEYEGSVRYVEVTDQFLGL